MGGKAEIAKLKKQGTADELENLFTQFDEQVHSFDEKITTIKKSIEEFEAKKITEENIEEKEGDNLPEDVVPPV